MGSRRSRRNGRYSAEFRAEAVKLVLRSDDTFAVLAERLGVNRGTLYSWYRDEMARKKPKKKRTATRKEETPEEELQRLRRAVKRLQRKLDSAEEDKVILKKAAAFFARESE